VTLALGITGVITISPSIVEPLIAASIIWVCIENVFSERMAVWRPLVIFGFGLLHGLGFAGVLGEIGLPTSQFVTALLSFNVGVELGQLTVIAVCFLVVGLWFRDKPWYRRVITIPCSLLIAAIGAHQFVSGHFGVDGRAGAEIAAIQSEMMSFKRRKGHSCVTNGPINRLQRNDAATASSKRDVRDVLSTLNVDSRIASNSFYFCM